MQTALYCCKCRYPELAGSLGSALGFQSYLEMGAAALVMILYLMVVKKGRVGGEWVGGWAMVRCSCTHHLP